MSAASFWSRRGRKLLSWAVLLQAAAVLIFFVLVGLGERTKLGFFALYAPRQPAVVASAAFILVAALTRRRALVAAQVALSLLVLFPLAGFYLHRPPTTERPPLRVATYNVSFGRLGRSALLEELAAMPADVLLLQEAYGAMHEGLRERFPERTVRQDGELVLVSRLPLLEVEVPPSLPGDVRPMFVTYVLETPDGPLTVTNVHPFSPRNALFGEADVSLDVARREAQVAAAVSSALRRGRPLLVGGDTNLPGLSAIAHRWFDGLDDAFAEAGVGFGYTFPTKRPWMRIDRVLGSPDVRFLEASVGPRGASDHRPLVVAFEISKTR